MVINQIHVPDITALKAEDDTPVSRHRDRPVAGEVAPQRVQSESRQVHVARLGRFIETGENTFDLGEQIGRNAPTVTPFEQTLEPCVAKANDDVQSCNLSRDTLQPDPPVVTHRLGGPGAVAVDRRKGEIPCAATRGDRPLPGVAVTWPMQANGSPGECARMAGAGAQWELRP